ncbi:M23 family metallopeptidase [Ornithinibacillus contaminans]|uniref:M23 family metallopeptidase n=1 Tax=Ornithinibacillus contaminans TaxID=694055 RepID=UPI00064DF864|nr:M23 family metallopeptidase [Ornithinibacillus contaminans]
MKKEIKDVRKSITNRKKSRGLPVHAKRNTLNTMLPSLPQDEEKHGFYPNFLDASTSNYKSSNMITGIILKGTVSVLLFFAVAILWQNDASFLEAPKEWTSTALTEEFPFASVYQWYQDALGEPLAFSPERKEATDEETTLALPVSGNVIETFQANGTGIMIAPTETTSVAALNEGIVVFAGNDRNSKKTVVIQHPDGSTSTYGFLSSIDVHLYQIITAHQRIGEFTPTEENEMVFFAIEKDNEYIDPVQVIEVDEN